MVEREERLSSAWHGPPSPLLWRKRLPPGAVRRAGSVFSMLRGGDSSSVIGLPPRFSDPRWELRGLGGYKETPRGFPASSGDEDVWFGVSLLGGDAAGRLCP